MIKLLGLVHFLRLLVDLGESEIDMLWLIVAHGPLEHGINGIF